jgi:hypothetical protein
MLRFFEDRMEMTCDSAPGDFSWLMELTSSAKAELPFTLLADNRIAAELNGFGYSVSCTAGTIADGKKDDSSSHGFRIFPVNNRIVLDMIQKPR